MIRAKQGLYWAIPPLLCLIVYWYGLRAWFQMDDFAWLALHLKVHDWPSFLDAMFHPYAQGTIRPWSERLFFMGGFWLFGLDALPFRAIVFLTQFLNLGLIALIVRKVTRSPAAGFLAAIFWVVNGNIYQPLSWTSAYNQVLCCFFLLLALWLFLRYTETGERKWYWLQVLVFVLGFGVLELNVVYPAIAALYAICCARKRILSTIPLWVISILYAVVNRAVAHKDETGVYEMLFDVSMWNTLVTYLGWMFGADRLALQMGQNTFPYFAMEAVVGIALLVFVVWKAAKRNWLALFFPGWFLITIALYLPLHNHVTDYYLTIPSVGLCMLGGWAASEAWKINRFSRAVVAVVALLYAVPSVWVASTYTYHNFAISQRVKNFMQHLEYAHLHNPGKVIVISGVDHDLFWTGWYDRPFQIIGLNDIYMTADTEPRVGQSLQKVISHHFLPDRVLKNLLEKHRAVVYEVVGPQLRNITGVYKWLLDSKGPLELPRTIHVGSPLYASQIGEGWYGIDDSFRWMSKHGTVRIRGPRRPNSELVIKGSCVPEQVREKPLFLTVSVDGRSYPPSRIDAANQEFVFVYKLRPELIGRPEMEVALEVDRTISTPQDDRKFGVVVDLIEVRP